MSDTHISAKPQIIFSSVIILLLVGIVAAWGATAQLSSAVIASGQIELAKERWTIQHPNGGRVLEIRVSDGDYIEEGDLLMRLDGAQLEASLNILLVRESELQASVARLRAERDGLDILEGEASEALESQRNLHRERLQSFHQSLSQIEAQGEQLTAQLVGLDVQSGALDRQISLMNENLEVQVTLLERGLTQEGRVRDLQLSLAQLEGTQGELQTARSIALGKQVELTQRRLSIETTRRERAIEQLREVEPELMEVTERIALVTGQLAQLEVRAPVTGILHDLRTHSVGGVIQAGALIAEVVPENAELVGVARIASQDIARINLGQLTELRIQGIQDRYAPKVFGTVQSISADVFEGGSSQPDHYRVAIALGTETDEQVALRPGMSMDAFFTSDARTPIAYLIEPLNNALSRTMREK